MTIHAFSLRATADSSPKIPLGWTEVIQSLPENARVLGIKNENLGMWMGYCDAWGYDPNVQKRYAEMVTSSQGLHPDSAQQYIPFQRTDFNLFPLMRVGAILLDNPHEPLIRTPKPMELAQLIPNATVLSDRNEILMAVQALQLEPRELVFLESDPKIKLTNKKSIAGTVKIVRQSTDDIEFEIDTADNAILLVTNSYSRSWRARPVGQSAQDKYEVMPADWAFQAIPLLAGKHHLILEYRPKMFVIGRVISIVSLVGYVAAWIWYAWMRRKNRRAA